MIRLTTILALVLLAQVVTPTSASAQDAAMTYNRARAYRQYQNSPSRLRTYSSYQSAQYGGYDSPLESGRFYLSPGFYHEQSGPFGVESYGVPQELSGAIYMRPGIGLPPPVNLPNYGGAAYGYRTYIR